MKNRQKIKYLLIGLTGFLLIIVFGVIILNNVIQEKVRKELNNISPALQVSYTAVHINLFASTVTLDNLAIKYTPYLPQLKNSHILQFSRADLKSISFFQFIFYRKFNAGNLIFEDGKIQLDKFLIEKIDSAQSEIFSKVQLPFHNLSIHHIELKNSITHLHSVQREWLVAKGSISVNEFKMNKPGSIHFETGDCSLTDIHFNVPGTHDSLHIQKMVLKSNDRIIEIDSLQLANKLKIPSLKFSGFNVKELITDRAIDINQLNIDQAVINIRGDAKMEAIQSLPFDLKKVLIQGVHIQDISLTYKDQLKSLSFRASASLGKINIKGLNKKEFDVGTALCILSQIRYSGDSYHRVEIKSLLLDSKKDLVRIRDIMIIPQFGKVRLGKKLGYQADRISATIPEIEIIKLQIRELFQNNLFAAKIKISSSRVHVFRDRRLPRKVKNSPLPVAHMKTLPINIRIKNCELASSTIEYEEYPQSGFGKTGTLRIERASLNLSPLINHPIATDPADMVMKVSGSIMGSGTASANIYMPLLKGRPYRIIGEFENVDLTRLNSSSENLGKIRIKSGFLDFLSFDFTMTEKRSTGKIIGEYHHLIIQKLKKHTDTPEVSGFASFMLRHAIIPLNKDKSLPEKKRTGMVNYARDPTRFVSHYYLQSLLTGIKASFNLGFLLPK